MYCVTGCTGTTGTTLYNQHTLFNLPKTFGHAVYKSQSDYKTKQTSASSGHIQAFIGAISYQPNKWGDLEHCHMTHALGEGGELTWVSMLRIKQR